MTPTRMKGLTLASRLCPSFMALPSVLPHSHAGRQTPGWEARRAGWASAGCGSRRPVSRFQSSADRERARPGNGCRRAAYSAHVRRPIQPGEPLGGGACATRSGCGRVRSRLSGFSAAAALSTDSSLVRNAAVGGGRPVGGRTAALRKEGGAVGGHRAPRPQGGRLAGGLLQQLFEAGRRRELGAAGSCAAFPASRASAGRPSEGWRAGVRVGSERSALPGEPRLSASLSLRLPMAPARKELSAGSAGVAGVAPGTARGLGASIGASGVNWFLSGWFQALYRWLQIQRVCGDLFSLQPFSRSSERLLCNRKCMYHLDPELRIWIT